MDMTRRTLGTTAAAAVALGALPAAAQVKKKPLIIAHRGASGERPESTLMAFRLAIAEGADFIEPDLVLTKDGHFVVRHENEISQTTDVALRPEFASRLTTRQIQGQAVSGWFTEDFTLEELKTIRCRERLPKLRPESVKFNGQEAGPNAPVFIQCFDVLPLKTIMTLSKAPRIQLVSPDGGPTDVALRYQDMVSASGMKAIAAYANGVGPDWSMVIPTVDGGLGPATALVADAHAAGLAVHPWTVRAENVFLPPKLRNGTDPSAHGDVNAVYKALYAAGVDGLFSDFPGLAVKARG